MPSLRNSLVPRGHLTWAQDADGGPSAISSGGHCSINGPDLSAKHRRPKGNEAGDAGNHRMMRPALEVMIRRINRSTQGWFNYFRHCHWSIYRQYDGMIRRRLLPLSIMTD